MSSDYDDEQPDRLEGHINAAEYWLNQADLCNFPDPARTECLQLAATHASLAQALTAAKGGEVTAIHMRIVQGHELIADLPEWPGPIPRVGDYIFHPPSQPGSREGIAGSVACVKWRTHDRPSPDATEFVMTAHPYVEIVLAS